MKKLSLALLSFLAVNVWAVDADSLPGIWAVPADEPLYHVSLTTQETGGKGILLDGIVVQTLEGAPETCRRCRGEQRGEPLMGMTLLNDIYRLGASWGGGTVLDPITGREWDAKFVISVDEKTVSVTLSNARFGTTITQQWARVEE